MAARMAVKTKMVGVKLTDLQYRAVAQRAEKCGVRMSTWIRSVLLQAAMKPVKDGHLRIKEPNGAMG